MTGKASAKRKRKKNSRPIRVPSIDIAEQIRRRRDRLLDSLTVKSATTIGELRIGSFYEFVPDDQG